MSKNNLFTKGSTFALVGLLSSVALTPSFAMEEDHELKAIQKKPTKISLEIKLALDKIGNQRVFLQEEKTKKIKEIEKEYAQQSQELDKKYNQIFAQEFKKGVDLKLDYLSNAINGLDSRNESDLQDLQKAYIALLDKVFTNSAQKIWSVPELEKKFSFGFALTFDAFLTDKVSEVRKKTRTAALKDFFQDIPANEILNAYTFVEQRCTQIATFQDDLKVALQHIKFSISTKQIDIYPFVTLTQ